MTQPEFKHFAFISYNAKDTLLSFQKHSTKPIKIAQ